MQMKESPNDTLIEVTAEPLVALMPAVDTKQKYADEDETGERVHQVAAGSYAHVNHSGNQTRTIQKEAERHAKRGGRRVGGGAPASACRHITVVRGRRRQRRTNPPGRRVHHVESHRKKAEPWENPNDTPKEVVAAPVPTLPAEPLSFTRWNLPVWVDIGERVHQAAVRNTGDRST